MKALCANFQESFTKLPSGSLRLKFLAKYVKKGSAIYVHKKTGVISSELKRSPKQILHYWSQKIFKSKNENDYSALYPFARGRLYYVARTLIDYLGKKEKNKYLVCDFATGQGVLPLLLKKEKPNWKIICTEGSQDLCRKIQKSGIRAYHGELGLGKLGKFQADIGFLTWTLCNCRKPLNVLFNIRHHIKSSGLLVVADSSRILVPFKKPLKNLFTRKHPADIHPFYFSSTTLKALCECAGFETVYTNRYFDSDPIVLICRKKNQVPQGKKKIKCDDYRQIVKFFKQYDKLGKLFSQ